MNRKRAAIAVIVVLVVLGGLRLVVTESHAADYRVLDDHTIAIRVMDRNPTWRAVTSVSESPTEVGVRIQEIRVHLSGPGVGQEELAEVTITLRDPLGTRRVVDASTGVEIRPISQ